MDDLNRLSQSLGATDRVKVGEYVDSVREVERRIQRVEKGGGTSELPTLERPSGIPERFDEHVKLMYDLQWLAFRADLTRVTTFMLGRELNFRTYPEIGINEGHHGLSHHQDNPNQLAKYATAGHVSGRALRLVPRQAAVHARRRRLAARSLAVPVWRRPEQSESPRALRSAAGGGRWRGRPDEGWTSPGVPGGDADDEPPAHDARQGGRAGGEAG